MKTMCCKMAVSFFLSQQAGVGVSNVNLFTDAVSLLAQRKAGSHFATQPHYEKANSRPWLWKNIFFCILSSKKKVHVFLQVCGTWENMVFRNSRIHQNTVPSKRISCALHPTLWSRTDSEDKEDFFLKSQRGITLEIVEVILLVCCSCSDRALAVTLSFLLWPIAYCKARRSRSVLCSLANMLELMSNLSKTITQASIITSL